MGGKHRMPRDPVRAALPYCAVAGIAAIVVGNAMAEPTTEELPSADLAQLTADKIPLSASPSTTSRVPEPREERVFELTPIETTTEEPDPEIVAVVEEAEPEYVEAEPEYVEPEYEPATAVSSLGQGAANVAMQYLGWPYVGDGSSWGGSSPSQGGFDCSGLMQWSWSQVGVNISRSTWGQISDGWSVGLGNVAPGDLIFTNGVGHVGMYVGNGQVIEAQSPGTNIMLTPLATFTANGVNDVRRMA